MPEKKNDFKEGRKYLIIAGSGIGNILLATPLMRALRLAYPDASIDTLVPEGRDEILHGNPDIDHTITIRRHAGLVESLGFLRRMWRQYDLTLCAQAGDRSIMNAWISGQKRFSHLNDKAERKGWPRLLMNDCVPADDTTHVVIHGLRLIDKAQVSRCYELVPPTCSAEDRADLTSKLPFDRNSQTYCVLHVYPRNPYKCWTEDGWQAVINHLATQGHKMVVTGSTAKQEQAYIHALLANSGNKHVINMSGKLNLKQASELLAGAALYVGPDTGVTHLAAAHGIPTVALYGPTNPVYWGPWPRGYAQDQSPYRRKGSQQINNVFLIQNDDDCVGCGKEGCVNDPQQMSRCMTGIPASRVIDTVNHALQPNQHTGTERRTPS